MKFAFKIGKSNFKHKKFRLVLTILLSVIAFSFFFLADVMVSYDFTNLATNYLQESNANCISYVNQVSRTYDGHSFEYDVSFSDNDLTELSDKIGTTVLGVYVPVYDNLEFINNINPENQENLDNKLCKFSGFAEISEETLNSMGFSVCAGRLPDASKNEIAISSMAAETFVDSVYISVQPVDIDGDFDFTEKTEKISDSSCMVGKTLLLDNILYTISGIIETKYDSKKFLQNNNQLSESMLYCEFNDITDYSLTSVAMVGKGKIKEIIDNTPNTLRPQDGSIYAYSSDNDISLLPLNVSKLSDIPADTISWCDAPADTLAENEVIISLDYVSCKSKSFSYFNDNKAFDDFQNMIVKSGGLTVRLSTGSHSCQSTGVVSLEDVVVVGFFKPDSEYYNASTIVMSDELISNFKVLSENKGYTRAISPVPSDRRDVKKIVKYSHQNKENQNNHFSLESRMISIFEESEEVLNDISKVFYFVAVIMGLFSSLLMMNFISISINYKKKEIGVLRAIGSRSSDIVKIFLSEGYILASIEFFLTIFISIVLIKFLNSKILDPMLCLHFGLRQILLIILVCIGVATIASYFSVKKIASKKPIEAIKNI